MTVTATTTGTRRKGGAASAATPFWARRGVRIAGGLVLPLLLLALWQFVTTTGIIPTYRLPTPVSVVEAAVQLAADGTLWVHVAISIQRVLLGFAIGAVVGLAIAAIVGLSRAGEVLLGPTIVALRAVPSLAWVPLLILWMQIGEDSKVTLIAIGAFFPVFTTVAAGLHRVDPHLVEAGRSFGLRGWPLLRTIQLPAVVPSMVAGLRLGLAQAWLFLVAAELVGASMGLGFLLTESQSTGRVDRIILAIVLLALLGTLTNALLSLFERAVLKRWL
ncbi:MAG: nitrate ABC transporter permease [Microbacterium sp.]|uniref:ABC transporter permease n=1 Tax=Microbacterium TaxID=33882 RepID=UPI000C3AD196|nr:MULTISPECIES: ABC transporter permease [Microbacterium]MAY48649.1 nitrate ABC transporter permease [Microbacterium sp.]HBS76191.1 nitrate ABC transporter permease [Microbacterium sp.]|tara:strand:- start:15353 stop:16177 length:825 start_codon:yes stop_codon:yes gene_type:complete